MLKACEHTLWWPWFAWLPVWVDAYHVTEIKDGQFRYRVWLRQVEYTFAYGSKENPVWKYRLPPIPIEDKARNGENDEKRRSFSL